MYYLYNVNARPPDECPNLQPTRLLLTVQKTNHEYTEAVMKLIRMGLAATTVLVVALACLACSDDNPTGPGHDHATARVDFQNAMRMLWEDHIVWTRLYIISAVSGHADLTATTQRLLQNQDDIGNAIKPFYGDAAGDQLAQLLKGHILTAAELLSEAKAGDEAGTAEASTKWYANADSIATFLGTANPENWEEAEMKIMMKNHLDLTLDEAVYRLQGNYAADIETYDLIHHQILEMADMLSIGVINQFPDRF